MRLLLSKTETVLVATCGALLGIAVLGSPLAQPAHYHAFADQRTLLQLPFFMDVASNLGFALAGLVGVCSLLWLPARALTNVQRAMAALFFGGLLLTAAASAWYHLAPDDAGLVIDRGGMALAFAGLLGLAAAGRVSERAGAALGLLVLVFAPWSIHIWSASGNLLPWAVLQAGGMVLVLWLALLRPCHRALEIRWGWVIAIYLAAKLLEMNDHQVYELTGQAVSGHTLKHLVAAFAAVPVITGITALRGATRTSFAEASKDRRTRNA